MRQMKADCWFSGVPGGPDLTLSFFLQQMIEAGEGHLHSGFLAGGGEQGNSAVGGVPAAGEAHRSLCGPPPPGNGRPHG